MTTASETNVLDIQPDWALVTAAQSGSNDAFGHLYTKYAPRVRSFLRRRMGNPALADDLTSDTFLRALRNIGSITYSDRGLGPWLQTIADNLAKDHFKSSRHRHELLTDDIADQIGRSPDLGPEQLVVDTAEREWASNRLEVAVANLPSKAQRECLSLLMRGVSPVDAAHTLGCSVGAVGALRHRALPHLRTLLTTPPHPAVAAATTRLAVPRGTWLRFPRSHRCRVDRCTRTPGRSGCCTSHYHKLYRAGQLRAGFTDPTLVRAHISEHLARGGSLRSLAALSGTTQASLSDLVAGRTARVRVGVSDAVLTVPLRPSNTQCAQWVGQLALAGHAMPAVAAAAKVPATTLYKAVQAGRFTDQVARGLRTAHSALSRRPGRSAMAARLANAKARAAA